MISPYQNETIATQLQETADPVAPNVLLVVIELKPAAMNFGFAAGGERTALASPINIPSLLVDESFVPISIKPNERDADFTFGFQQDNVLIRATVPENEIESLKQQPDVVNVWRDTPIAPFALPPLPYDCASSVSQGTLRDVALYLGAGKIWNIGHKGEGIVVAVADGGITAAGKPIAPGETGNRINNVADGWPANWGTTAKNWNDHGNMCATDVLGIASGATLYDVRISDGGAIGAVISNALSGFQWCINHFRSDGTPHIITNSWGIYQSSWDAVYASNPTHFFTRKVVEAINEGIIVLFAAGNCGDTCPDGRCGTDAGPSQSIWGANGHPDVITIAAVNKNEEYAGYSSQGPAALDNHKPDICSITHFQGYFACDNGTSAATPIAAGVVALMKQKNAALTTAGAKKALITTAKDPWAIGWNENSVAGIIQAKDAYDAI